MEIIFYETMAVSSSLYTRIYMWNVDDKNDENIIEFS
jgi:hypothetical protein